MVVLSGGKVAVSTPGTPVVVTANMTDPTVCNNMLIQADKNNIGHLYVGLQGMNKTTRVGVIGILPPPTPSHIPSFEIEVAVGMNQIDPTAFFLDADVEGNGGIVSTIVI